MNNPIISVQDVSKCYWNGEVQTVALRKANLEIYPGESIALVGPSGCGKSTLLHLIAGIDTPTQGEIYVDGYPFHLLKEEKLAKLRGSILGIVFQFFNLLPTLTALDNVMLPALLQGVSPLEASSRAKELLEQVGLSHRSHHYPHQLSGGEMQRVALARALVMKPKIVLADEPTGNLDSEASQKVLYLLRKLVEQYQLTLLMVTHSLEVAKATDRILQMKDGYLIS
ncbi:ABC transporter ATP-binding protein [Candidatus Methylacidiphilum fumarolicum]|uniref:ABC-type antimicrobial peptide transport system,ATPase component n=2 Tax=Candidatus Methylacidiphilum fumarolicum TaxID=591154 RepID=I0K1A0_METFB|nr:ABC transporter ATP-binding protein [Candidatus Methylacidiphilum fumarolicum]MBW6414975.1 ABC transporter ATP-binding protein [Candidatus Methylacidiphilum fumarolicum]TFE70338.1 ABC transporter ATP-binding protein [Candidatus Methylacidiphilum fumarolicum]TFE73981.1 ABC transporter ATP-binding protein [Candidatus Methylacidiphilum fumarolicum]TFE74488.1 ABC transporter ATP-binding protein [Candidatus Methylacidiphilum fumarolicum]TFE77850.1 ABC transporter ATP-binding protein [Candidatus 